MEIIQEKEGVIVEERSNEKQQQNGRGNGKVGDWVIESCLDVFDLNSTTLNTRAEQSAASALRILQQYEADAEHSRGHL